MKNIISNPRANGSVFLHFRFSLLFFMMIGVLTNTSAQVSPVFTCGTPNPSVVRGSQNNLPSLRSACTDRNITKYVSVNVQFILKSDGTGNYNETSDGLGGSVSGYQAAYELIRTANELLANNPKVYQPIGNSTPIPAVRIQYVLKGVYFIRNTTVYNYTYGSIDLLDGFAVNPNSEISIFISGITIGVSGVARNIGVFSNPYAPTTLIGDKMWNSYNQGYTKTVFYQSTPILFKWFYYAQIVTHELGHLMNLYHPFENRIAPDNDGCTDTYTLSPRSFEPIPPQTTPLMAKVVLQHSVQIHLWKAH